MAVENIAGPLSSLDYRIRFAIAHRRLIEVTYQRFTRLAEPHDYGTSAAPTGCSSISFAVQHGRDTAQPAGDYWISRSRIADRA